MTQIFEALTGIAEPAPLVFFIILCLYVLVVDVHGHRSRGMTKETKFFKILALACIGVYSGLLLMVSLF